jgi:hypothetical protein
MAQGSKYTNISSATTTQVLTGRGRLMAIIVNTAVISGVITIYDNTTTTGTPVSTITEPGTLLQNHYVIPFYGIEMNLGIRIVTSAAHNLTVIWDK